jgi:hypothetical protein
MVLVKPASLLICRLRILSTGEIQKSERHWNFWTGIFICIVAGQRRPIDLIDFI